VLAAIAGFLILQTMLGWSWDAWTIGFVILGIGWIAFQWWRRYPHG
jgi:hypothetical protein